MEIVTARSHHPMRTVSISDFFTAHPARRCHSERLRSRGNSASSTIPSTVSPIEDSKVRRFEYSKITLQADASFRATKESRKLSLHLLHHPLDRIPIEDSKVRRFEYSKITLQASIARRLTLPIHRPTSHNPHPRFVNIREIRHSGIALAAVILRCNGICTLRGWSFIHAK
jgi:hypothetical protein